MEFAHDRYRICLDLAVLCAAGIHVVLLEVIQLNILTSFKIILKQLSSSRAFPCRLAKTHHCCLVHTHSNTRTRVSKTVKHAFRENTMSSLILNSPLCVYKYMLYKHQLHLRYVGENCYISINFCIIAMLYDVIDMISLHGFESIY